MPGLTQGSAPGTRSSPNDSQSASPSRGVESPSDSSSDSPTSPKEEVRESPEDEKQKMEERRRRVQEARAKLPPPESLQDEEVYMATLRSGNVIPLTGRELKDALTQDRPPGLGQQDAQNTSGNGSDGGSSEGRKWWQNVLVGVGEIGGIFLRDRLSGEESGMTDEERQALEEIARRRREERRQRLQRNRLLLIGGVGLVGALGLWYFTSGRSAAPAPPPPQEPPPGEGPPPGEEVPPEQVEVTDVERENAGDGTSSDENASGGDAPQQAPGPEPMHSEMIS